MSTEFSRVFNILGVPCGDKLDRILSDLHTPSQDSVAAGRNVTAGYTRGWGLEYGGLAKSIAEDPVYQESLSMCRHLSLLGEHKLMNIFIIMKYGFNGIQGDIFEFGSYRGGSAIFIANVARRLGIPGKIYAFDTYEGMPKTSDAHDLHNAGDFSDASLTVLNEHIGKYGLDNLIPVKGLFEATTPSILAKTKHISLAHIDCDIYSGVQYAISSVIPYMHPSGGYLVFDDPLHGSCLGAMEAVEEMIQTYGLRAEQAYPHLVYRVPALKS